MSTTIDERVVEMRFDNKDFESNVSTSMSTIDKLKKSLKFDDSTDGFNNITKAASKVDLSVLTNASESVGSKFSAMEVVAITALSNITSSAIDAGTQLVKSLSVDQITEGWSKYEDKTTAVQTIMSATTETWKENADAVGFTGTQMEFVTEQLEKLNWFSDETSYSFTDMTSNIGKFTSNGVALTDAVQAMQGISTWAAKSGQSTDSASRAMYNLAQAISVGSVKLIDWKSIENANMATTEFKQTAIDTAVELGTLKKVEEGLYQTTEGTAVSVTDFNSALSEGWFSSDVLMSTLNQYGAASVRLGEICDEYDTTSSKFLSGLENYQKGTMTIGDISSSVGISAEELIPLFDELSSEEYKLGLSSFKAAQEAKTFTEAINATKDAVSTGWMTTFDTIFGNYEEAKVLWTDLSNTLYDIFAEGGNARNELLADWKEAGGRDSLINSLYNSLDALVDIIELVKTSFRDIFPSMTAERLLELTEDLESLTEKFKMSDETSEKLSNTLKGIFAVLDIVKQAISAVFDAIKPLLTKFTSLSSGILNTTSSMGIWLANLDETIKKNDTFAKAIQNVIDFVSKAIESFKEFAKTVKEKFDLPDISEIKESLISVKDSLVEFIAKVKEKFVMPGFEAFHDILVRMHERMSQVGNAAESMKSGIVTALEAISAAVSSSKFLEFLLSLWNLIKTIAKGITSVLGELFSIFTEKVGNVDFNGLTDLINGLALGGVALGLKSFLKSMKESFDGISDILEGVTDILDGVKDCFKAYQEQLKAGTLIKIASAIAILTASIVALSLIDSDKLNSSIGAMTVLFTELMSSMAIFSKIVEADKDIKKAAAAMIEVSVAILILATAMNKIAGLEVDELGKGLTGIAGLAAIVVTSAKVLSSGEGQIIKGAANMVIFAAAIKILAAVCKDLSSLEWDELAKGLTGVGALFAEIDIFLNTAKFSGNVTSTATGMVVLAAALKILASVCKDFADMEWSEIAKGLTSVGALLAELTIFTNLNGNAKNMVSTGVALVAIAASMKIFASAMSDFGNMQWDEIARGLVAMAGALAEIVIALNLMPDDVLVSSVALIAVGAALNIIASALINMGNMQWDEIARGLVAMGGAIAELAIGLNVMNGTLAGSAAMLIAAAALAAITPVLCILGAMNWESIAKGLVALAGAFAIIGVAGAVLTPIIPSILSLGAAIALIGVGILGIGSGLTLAAVGLAAFVAAVSGGATAIMAALVIIAAGIADIIILLIEKLGDAVVALCDAIVKSCPALADAFTALVIALVDVFVDCIGPIIDGLLKILDDILIAIVKYTPSIVDSIMQFLIDVVEGVALRLPELLVSVMDFIMAFFEGIVEALKSIDTDFLMEGIVGIGLVSALLLALSAIATLVPEAIVGVLGVGAVIAEIALVLAAIGALAQIPGLNWLINEGGKFLEAIGVAIGEFVGGIVGGFMSGVSSQFPQIGSDLSEFMTNLQPFIEGAAKIDSSVTDSIISLAKAILVLTAADILQGLTSWITGGASIVRFGMELAEFGPYFSQYYESIKNIDGAVVSASASAANSLAEFAANIPNQGGMVSWFTGDNTLSKFAAELAEFGPKLKKYADSVSGLDTNVVTNSTNAAKTLSEMAANLPNQGGMVSWFTGDNTLSKFGKELVTFGPYLKKYSDSIKGLDPNIVTSSTNAAKSLAELESNLPNQGGMVSWFTGDNTLSKFGKELVSFGEGFSKYASYMKNVDAEIVASTVSAANSIVELQKTLPKQSGWFSDETSLVEFGSDMSMFGYYFSLYYSCISGINTTLLSKVIEEVENIVSLADGMNTLDTSGMLSFGETLNKLGTAGIDGFIDSFENSYSKIKKAVSDMVDVFSDSVKSKAESASEAFSDLIYECIKALNSESKLFATSGETLIIRFCSGIKSKYDDIVSIGKYIMDGIVQGLNDNSGKVTGAVAKLGNDILATFRDTLGIHSPSKEFSEAGEYSTEGYAEGITNGTNTATDAASDLGSTAVSTVSEYSSDYYDAGKTAAVTYGDGFEDGTQYVARVLTDDQTKLLKTAKSEYDVILTNLKNGVLSVEQYNTQFKNLLTKNASIEAEIRNYATEQRSKEFSSEISAAEKAYDEILKAYKNAKITQSEYDKEYTELLKEYTLVQTEVVEYAQDEMTDYVTDSLDKLVTAYEKEITSLQKEIDSFESKLQISYSDALTFTTNKDLYDTHIASYTEKIEQLNEKLEESKTKYGEDSWQAQNYQKQIDSVTASMEQYKKLYTDSGLNDSDIIDVKFNTNIEDETKKLKQYNANLEYLMNRDVDINQDMLDMISGLSVEQGIAVTEYLNRLSDEELKAIQNKWDKYTEESEKVSAALYSNKAQEITDDFVDDVVENLNKLPDSAKEIGKNAVLGLADGFSESTEETLKSIGSSTTKVVNYIKKLLGIHSPSTVLRDEVGSNMGKGVGLGFIDSMKQLSADMFAAIPTEFGEKMIEITDSASNGLNNLKNTLSNLFESIGSDFDSQPTIKPVIDISDVEAGAERINALMSRTQAVNISDSMNTSLRNSASNQNESASISSGTTINFTQNNTSPKALSRAEINRDTKSAIQLINLR